MRVDQWCSIITGCHSVVLRGGGDPLCMLPHPASEDGPVRAPALAGARACFCTVVHIVWIVGHGPARTAVPVRLHFLRGRALSTYDVSGSRIARRMYKAVRLLPCLRYVPQHSFGASQRRLP